MQRQRAEILEEPAPNSGTLIPRLHRALDPSFMLHQLQKIWPESGPPNTRLSDLTIERVYDRGEHGFVILYEITLSKEGIPQRQTLIAELVHNDASAYRQMVLMKLRKLRRGQWRASRKGKLVQYLPDPGLVVRPICLDERLPGLKLVYNLPLANELFTSIWDDPENSRTVRAIPLNHRLGKRCVVQFVQAGPDNISAPSLIAKMFKATNDKGVQSHRINVKLHEALNRKGSEVLVPRPVIYLSEYDVSLMEHVEARPLHLGESFSSADALFRTGRALHKFQHCGVEIGLIYGAENEIDLLSRAVCLSSEVFPDYSDALKASLLHILPKLQEMSPPESVLCHRDFHEKQVLLAENNVYFIDFDTLAMGDPAIDIGNFLAHIKLSGLVQDKNFSSLETAFLFGYGKEKLPPGLDRIQIYLRASLLRLACMNIFSTRRKHLVPALLRMVWS